MWVSNHGGRQLDYGPATLEALTEVVAGLQDYSTKHSGNILGHMYQEYYITEMLTMRSPIVFKSYTPACILASILLCDMASEQSLPALYDGGVRRGTDIAKALALGAKCVFVGRPVIHALAAGVQKRSVQFYIRRALGVSRDRSSSGIKLA